MIGRTVKKYTVNLIEAGEDKKKYELHTSLPKARASANAHSRANNFVSLLNFKRVALPI
jgi:hypothetical protein